MRLRQLVTGNFKLLRDVTIKFSTDADHPLTVIRAENGTGKTSLLYALIWGFYGRDGLPVGGDEPLRLSSTLWPPGTPCPIDVRIEFEVADESDAAHASLTRYTLTRSVVETPSVGDAVEAQRERLTLHRHTDAGAEALPDADAQAVLRRYAPTQMKDIYFTNGDAVQQFISGKHGSTARQQHVRDAIKALLGLDDLRTARDDLNRARTSFRRRLAAEAGAGDLSAFTDALDAAQTELADLVGRAEKTTERLAVITASIDRKQARIDELNHLGELSELRDRRETAKRSLADAESALELHKRAQRELLKSEQLSWTLMGEALGKGRTLLEQLHDRGIIPGTSQQVLRDRLDLKRCICGEPLTPGSKHRHAVETLLAEQAVQDPRKERLTQLLYTTNSGAVAPQESDDDDSASPGWLERLTEIETLRQATERQIHEQIAALRENDEAMRRLQDADVDRLYDQRDREQRQREDLLADQRELQVRQQTVQDRIEDLARQEERARSQLKVGEGLRDRVDVTGDLLNLLEQTLGSLEGETLQRASARMNDLFMEIIGASGEHDASVISEARLTDNYEIEVCTAYGRTLDTDFELSGAQQRALTLSFIWALMEIAEVAAPRIIDTPLGMMSGGLKTRFVDLLTTPSGQDFQIVLLMTRSEIATVDDLLDVRAGVSQTLTCSKDVIDLVHDWGNGEAIVKACVCTHRESCDVCARKHDEQYSLHHRAGEAAGS